MPQKPALEDIEKAYPGARDILRWKSSYGRAIYLQQVVTSIRDDISSSFGRRDRNGTPLSEPA